MQDKSVLSPGATEKGGFYNFGGSWSPQQNKGVNCLTIPSQENAICIILLSNLIFHVTTRTPPASNSNPVH